MPGKIKTGKQFRLFEAAAHGNLKSAGPSQAVAKKMLGEESHATKSRLAKVKRSK